MSRRVVVLGAGAAGLSAANRLAKHAEAGADLDIVLLDRAGEHVFAPAYVSVMFGDAEPAATRRDVAGLLRPPARLVTGEAARLDPDSSVVSGDLGDLPYDDLVLALGAEVGWPGGPGPAGDLAPWTLAGALAGRERLKDLGPADRVLVGPMGLAYRCPPAVFDLAVRIRRSTQAQVEVVHPWPRPLAPFGEGPSAAFTSMLEQADVGFQGGFTIAEVAAGVLTSEAGARSAYTAAFLVPPHRPPAVVAGSLLAGPSGWPDLSYPTFAHPRYPNVAIIGDLASFSLKVGMAGTLAVFEAAHVADRIAASAGGPPAADLPQMPAICFVDPGHTGSFLHCDFTGPAAGTGPAACTLMPWLPYFRPAKRLFAQEWFDSMLTGEIA